MKLVVRILLVVGSFFIAYAAGMYAERYTVAPLGIGRFEGTPATLVVFLAVFALMFFGILLVGNIVLNRYFRAKQ